MVSDGERAVLVAAIFVERIVERLAEPIAGSSRRGGNSILVFSPGSMQPPDRRSSAMRFALAVLLSTARDADKKET
jgi:hypothetical protein